MAKVYSVDEIKELKTDKDFNSFIKRRSVNKEDLSEIIINLAYFFKGSATFEWLENQPIWKLFELAKKAEKIANKINKDSGNV